MKAESIEQIREHLERGGKVKMLSISKINYGVIEVQDNGLIKVSDMFISFKCPFDDRVVDHWELLPLEEKPLPGIPASSLPLVTEDPTGQSCDDCEHCHGKGGRWDDESIDQWYWCEHCDAAEKRYAPLREKKQRKEKRHHELRAKVLFGQPWSIEEQLEVWELLTGERIEHGQRCERCGGEGHVFIGSTDGTFTLKCSACINHPGYTVRPTWMGEG